MTPSFPTRLSSDLFLKLFAAWGAEVSVLIDWARRQGSGSVALGGVSLGALTSQLTAVAARDWPAELRPDALLLIASSQDLKEVAFNGSLATAIGLPARLEAAGWNEIGRAAGRGSVWQDG